MTCPICNTTNSTRARICAKCDAPLKLDAQYRVVGLLGRGGMNAVYRAEHTALGTVYALKEIIPDLKANIQEQQEARDQFKFEAEILARLRHDALPRVTDFFTEARTQRQYLVMELVEGETLEEILEKQNRPFESAIVIGWLKTVCEILTYLHAQTPPVLHRDIKPSNLKLTPQGKLYLIDFGIARVAPSGSKTKSGARAFSAPYSPIEQYGEGTAAPSDVYALGVTAYQLLTNQLPPAAPNRVNEQVVAPSVLNAKVPKWLSDAVLKAMAMEQAKRFQTADEFQQALAPSRQAAAGPVFAAAPALAPTTTRQLARPGTSFPWIPIGLVTLVCLGVFFLLFRTGNLASLQTPFTAAAPTPRPPTQANNAFGSALPTRIPPTRPRTKPPPSAVVLPPTRPRATVSPTSSPVPPRGILLENWGLRLQNGSVIFSGGSVPPKTRFTFELQITNHTDAGFSLEQFGIQVRSVGADYVWNLAPAEVGFIGLGETQQIVTKSLDLGAGSFVSTALYLGKPLTDDRNAPYQFSFQVGR